MDAVKFLKEKKRMCDFFHNQALCSKCPIQKLECGIGELGDVEHMIAAVEAVEKWAAEHPAKTRQSEFLKIFPNARIVDGAITIEPCDIDNKRCGEGSKWCDDHIGCEGCREDYWLTEVEECDTNS